MSRAQVRSYIDAVDDGFFAELRRIIPGADEILRRAIGSLRDHPGSDAPRDAREAIERLLEIHPDDLVIMAIIEGRESGEPLDEDALIAASENPDLVRRMLRAFSHLRRSD